jgi:hypothetical protein
MNRELRPYFAHLGMSTPYALSSNCLSHLVTLKPQCILSYAIDIQKAVRLRAALCLCAYAPLDFSINSMAAAESVEAGAFELL